MITAKPLREVIAFLLAIVLPATFISCSRTNKPIVIHVIGEDFSNTQALEAFKHQDEQALGFQIDFAKNTFDVFNQRANQDLASGTGLYDIILHYSSVLSSYGGNRWVLTLAEQKALLPSADYSFESDIFPDVWRDSSFFPIRPSGTPQALGYRFCANTMVLVYSRKLFEDAAKRSAYKARYREDLDAQNVGAVSQNSRILHSA